MTVKSWMFLHGSCVPISCLLSLGSLILEEQLMFHEVCAQHPGMWGVEGRKTEPIRNGRWRAHIPER